ncbi:hypothetical protein CRG98_048991, partial [Punica granatum]
MLIFHSLTLRRSSPSNNDVRRSSGSEEEMLKPTPASSFRKQSSLLRAKTRSRLMDPPEESDLHGAWDEVGAPS